MSSSISLTTNFNLPGGAVLDLSRPDFNDDLLECKFSVVLRANGANGSARICAWDMTIRDPASPVNGGLSDKVARNATPNLALNIEDVNRYFVFTQRSVANAYSDLFAAWKSSGTGATRQAAFKAALLSAGHIDATLTGT
jgi:hypothetical protein